METENLQHEDHPPSHLCQWPWHMCHTLLVRGTQQMHPIVELYHLSPKADMVGKMQSAWIWKVLYGTNSWKESLVNFDEPRKILKGSSSFWCVWVPRYTWPLTALQSCSINKNEVCVEVDIRHFLFLFEHAKRIHEKHSACPLNAVNGNMVLGILVLLTISKDVPIIADWAILRSR